jgi:hypothetical protein
VHEYLADSCTAAVKARRTWLPSLDFSTGRAGERIHAHGYHDNGLLQ